MACASSVNSINKRPAKHCNILGSKESRYTRVLCESVDRDPPQLVGNWKLQPLRSVWMEEERGGVE